MQLLLRILTSAHTYPRPSLIVPGSEAKLSPTMSNVVNDWGEGGDMQEIFIYTGQENDMIKRDVIHVRVHPSVKVIKDNAFGSCYDLATVILNEGLEEIGRAAFSICIRLKRIAIPNSVKTIKDMAFCGCSNLTIATLGEGLEEIGKEAFNNCSELQHITIPPAIKVINNRTFIRCYSLKTVDLNEGLEKIGEKSFCRCVALQLIKIPSTVKTIRDEAFEGCSGLTRADLNEGLEEIGKQAFRNCTSLFVILIPPTVRAIKDYAFDGCSRLPAGILNGLDERRREIYLYTGQDASDIQRDVINVRVHLSVKAIKDRAFKYCEQLTTVILNDGLEQIGEEAFRQCTSLQHIMIPPTVKAIQRRAFYDCSRLTTINLSDGLEEIGKEAFQNCSLLQRIVIPPAIDVIEDRAFKLCLGLTSVTFNEKQKKISKEAFMRCESLQRIVIPPAIKAIEGSAFGGCSSLTNVEFCVDIEEFASSETMRGWRNQSDRKKFYFHLFLVNRNIPERLGLVQVESWRASIYKMLGHVPPVSEKNRLDAYFDTINSKLTVYESLSEYLNLLLEVANHLGVAISNEDTAPYIMGFF
jgi:hypothetical protein